MKPNIHGIFEEDDSQTLEDQFRHFDIWWSDENIFFPYLICNEEVPIGFAFVAKTPYCPVESEICLHEFFLLRPYRGTGLGKVAAKMIFNRFPGRWSFYTNPSDRNFRTQEFWRSFLNSYVSKEYKETSETTKSGSKVLAFRFEVI